MTEYQWLNESWPFNAIRHLSGVYDEVHHLPMLERKLQLFAAACYWQFAEAADAARALAGGSVAAECAETVADTNKQLRHLPTARYLVNEALYYADQAAEMAYNYGGTLTREQHGAIQCDLVRDVMGNIVKPVLIDYEVVRKLKRHRGVTVPTAEWDCLLAEPVERMANSCYRDRLSYGVIDPEKLLVLRDALLEAGCTNEQILRHLAGEEVCERCCGTGMTLTSGAGQEYLVNCGTQSRNSGGCLGLKWRPRRGPHVRGCWVLDLILRGTECVKRST